MNDPHSSKGESLSRQVGVKAERHLRAQRRRRRSEWTGFAFFGLIGWSVVVPTLAGAGIGTWLDSKHPGGRSWTLTLLVAGLVLGCFNAWRWVAREHRSIQQEEQDHE